MKKRVLDRLRRDLEALRLNCADLRPRTLIGFAEKLGRRRKPGFTNEPTYVRERDPALTPPLSIPAHRTLKTGTARNIINMLLDDVDDWEQYVAEHGEE